MSVRLPLRPGDACGRGHRGRHLRRPVGPPARNGTAGRHGGRIPAQRRQKPLSEPPETPALRTGVHGELRPSGTGLRFVARRAVRSPRALRPAAPDTRTATRKLPHGFREKRSRRAHLRRNSRRDAGKRQIGEPLQAAGRRTAAPRTGTLPRTARRLGHAA